MIETVGLVEPWIYHRLSTDTALLTLVNIGSISGTLSVEVLPTPYVTFLCQSPRDVVGNAGQRISTDNLYMIKAVAQTGTWDDILPIADRIDALFHLSGQVISVSGGSLSSVRQSVVQYPEVDDGLQYRHLGGIFRIRASAN